MFVRSIFTETELAIIHQDLDQQLQRQDWHSWDRAIVNVEHTTDFPGGYPKEQGNITFKFINGPIKDLLRQKISSIDPMVRGYDFAAFYQVWDAGSATGLHDDSRYMFTATFYLNKIWSPDDGGLYVYLDGDQYKAYVPEYNSCAFTNQSTLEKHLVTPITNNAPEKRYTIHCKGKVIK